MALKFTVLIPTRERCETLVHTLRSCTAQTYDNFEIVVADNCSLDNTREVVEAASDPRVRYIRSHRRISMSSNFELAMQQVTAGYLMHLGDDDALLPGAIEFVANIIEQTGALAVSNASSQYYWPDFGIAERRGELSFACKPGYAIRRTDNELAKLLRFETSYTELPSTYSGFVAREVVERAKVNGRYYYSRTPDVYSAIVNASVLETYAYSYRPFSLAGLSSKSNGASVWERNSKAEAARFESESDLPFHAAIAYAPSLEFFCAEAFLQARNVLPSLRDRQIDIARLTRVALRESATSVWPAVASAVAETRRRASLSPDRATLALKKPFAIRWAAIATKVQRAARKLHRDVQLVDTRAYGVTNVEEAARLTRNFLDGTYKTSRAGQLGRWLGRL